MTVLGIMLCIHSWLQGEITVPAACVCAAGLVAFQPRPASDCKHTARVTCKYLSLARVQLAPRDAYRISQVCLCCRLSSSLKLGRPLTTSDVEVLAVVAKFLDSMHTAAGREVISYEEWTWFGNWFLR